MNLVIVALLIFVIVLVIYLASRPPQVIKVVEKEDEPKKSFHDHVVDNIIDYRFYNPFSYYHNIPRVAPFGYRAPYFYRVGGSPYRYRKGGRSWGGRRRGMRGGGMKKGD
jgi:hypothetical protein